MTQESGAARRSRTRDPSSPDEPAQIGPDFDSVLQAAGAGAPWALERLYQALSPAVVGYLRVKGADDPEDLTNEVFLGVLRRIASVDGTEGATHT